MDLADNVFTTREWGWVKRLSGYMPGNLEEGLSGMDPELICVFATIALRRAGKIEARDVPAAFDRIADAPFGSTIRLDTDMEAVTEVVPPQSPPSSNTNGTSSGPDSTTSSGTSAANPDAFWDPRVGFFGVGPGQVGELTPSQLLPTVEYFGAIHGVE